jgi:hypothetical protein
MVVPVPGADGHALLTLSPLYSSEDFHVRLACLIHAANVRSEPGSNPSKKCSFKRHPSRISATRRSHRSHDEWFVLSFGLRSSSTDEASRTPPKGPTLCSALLTDSSQASFSQEPTEFSKIRHSARAELTLLGPPVLVPLSDSALRLDSSRRPSHRSFRADSVLPAALGSAPLACEGCQVRRERAAKTTLRLAPVKTP